MRSGYTFYPLLYIFVMTHLLSCGSHIVVRVLNDRVSQGETIPEENPTIGKIKGFRYQYNEFTFLQGNAITPIQVIGVEGDDIEYSVSPSLPTGLNLEQKTGTISGTPNTDVFEKSFTITASNNVSSMNYTVTITISNGIIVDTLNDGADDNGGTDSTCYSTLAAGCSLRAAIETINNNISLKTIILGNGVHQVTSAMPVIVDDLYLEGRGHTNTSIVSSSVHAGYRLFSLDGVGKIFKLSKIRIQDFGEPFGLINGAALTVINGSYFGRFNYFFNNRGNDGAVFRLGGGGNTLHSRESQFISNTADGDGGVLKIFSGTANFESVYAYNNKGIYGSFTDLGASGTVFIYNSTLFQNGVTLDGVTSSTDGSYIIENSTITENYSNASGGTGGLYGHTSTVNYNLSNNIISANVDTTMTLTNCYKKNSSMTIVSNGGNILDGAGSNCVGDFVGINDQLITDPVLQLPPTMIFGKTPSIKLQANSPAIDSGVNSQCLSTDQRGIERPIDYIGSGALCDSGAVEMIK